MSAPAFDLPVRLEAHEPPEARGLRRDGVRLMVATRHDGRIVHARFADLPSFLSPGDLVVVNVSGTLPAAVTAARADGASLELHLSTPAPRLAGGYWLVELRRDGAPFAEVRSGERLSLPDGGRVTILAPYAGGTRLWLARVEVPGTIETYLGRHGRPIRYAYVEDAWPLPAYQNVYAVEPYEGWGGYGSSKAALDQLTAILAAEHPELRVYAVDPGDMRTQMHQDAFPGEDISDRPPPEESVPGLLALIEGELPSGRYRARELREAHA